MKRSNPCRMGTMQSDPMLSQALQQNKTCADEIN